MNSARSNCQCVQAFVESIDIDILTVTVEVIVVG